MGGGFKGNLCLMLCVGTTASSAIPVCPYSLSCLWQLAILLAFNGLWKERNHARIAFYSSITLKRSHRNAQVGRSSKNLSP